jgi:molybdopterin/thiamine biosynthesis adenylyltransferase
MSLHSKRICRHAVSKPVQPRDARFSVFDRQQKQPGFVQGALSMAVILIIGLGGIGVRFARTLARMGIGNLVLVEHDRVEDTNLHRQDLYFPKDVGSSKAFAAVRNLLPHCIARTEITAYNQMFEDMLALGETFEHTTAFVCGVDNDHTRERVYRHFAKLGIPGVVAAIDTQGLSGAVFVQEPGQACWRCSLPPNYQNQAAPCGAASSPEVLDLVAGHGVFALMTLLQNRPRNWNYRFFTLPGFMADQVATVERRRNCSYCGA